MGNSKEEPDYTWDDLVAAIGTDFSTGEEHIADETISYTDVVRYCEPWEIGNPIYWDEASAKQAGYRGVVVPWSAIKQTFSYGGFWRPGEPTRFPTPDPAFWGDVGDNVPKAKPLPKPKTIRGLVTHMEIEFFEPVVVGDRLHVKGRRLIDVRPRQTKLGFGAFTTMESEVYNQLEQLVARVRAGSYPHNPDTQK